MAYKPDKHGRDHCPGGEDPIPCWPGKWMRLSAGGGTATTATWTKCGFQVAESMFDDTAAIFDWTTAGGGTRYVAQLRTHGLYWYEIQISWTDAPFAGGVQIDATPVGGTAQPNYDEENSMAHQRDSSLTEWQGIHRISGMLWLPENDTAEFDPSVKQTSGVNRAFDANSLRFLYLGPMGPSAKWRFETLL